MTRRQLERVGMSTPTGQGRGAYFSSFTVITTVYTATATLLFLKIAFSTSYHSKNKTPIFGNATPVEYETKTAVVL